MRERLTFFALACLIFFPLRYAKAAEFPFQDPGLPLDQRVSDLVGRMTPQEKISQMTLTAAAIPRLGIPEYTWWNEGLHGIARSGTATVFPQAVGLAATFDTTLMHTVGDTISTEARAKYADAIAHNNHRIYFGLTIWSPNINIFRDPRWGRGQETYGEDPYLTSRMGLSFITGLQGDDPKYLKTVATPKHFAVHSGPESLRHEFDVKPSPQDLEATYLPAFHAAIVEGKAASTMCAYNAIDGAPACANPLLRNMVRGTWQFHGFVTSDCWAVTDIWKGHRFAPDEEHAAALALKAGTDTSCGPEFASLNQALKDGLVTQAEIDAAVTRLYTARFRLGMFDPPEAVPYSRIPRSEIDSAAHRSLARKVAEESFVLLKNNGQTLPLHAQGKTIAVIGPNSAVLESLEGNYSGQPSHPVLPIDGVEERFGKDNKVLFAQGSSYVAGFPVVVPRGVLNTSTTAGLKAEYFNNATFEGAPVLTRVDSQVDFDWAATSPAENVSPAAFSVRWSGTLSVPGVGNYVFHLAPQDCTFCDGVVDKFRLYLDEKAVIDTGRDGKEPVPNASFSMHFSDTAAHNIRVEYSHSAPMFGAGIHLLWEPEAAPLREQAVQVARQADVVLAFVGLSPSLEGEEMPVQLKGFKGGDRTKIDLPQLQIDLLQAVAATGKPVVVVLMNGSALAVPWINEHAAAALEAWYPGEEGGAAIAETLAGDQNPAGRLPVTFYASLAQLPPFDDYAMKGRTYRYFSGEPLYSFGYGLSYTSFAYARLKLSSATVRAGDPLDVEADVTNTGKVAGDEVVQLYLRGPQTDGAPLRQLRSFSRITLQPGEIKHVTFTLDAARLSEVDTNGTRAVQPGDYGLYVGGGQPGHSSGVEGKFSISGRQALTP